MKKLFLIFLFLAFAFGLLISAYAEKPNISCQFVFAEESAQIGKPFSFTYALSGGSGEYKDISFEAEFVTVYEGAGHDVDGLQIEIGSQGEGTIAFTPVAGTAAILWLRGYDAVTGEYFYLECHEGWLPITMNPDIAVTFQLPQSSAYVNQPLELSYQIDGTSSVRDAKIWWQIISTWSGDRINEQDVTSTEGVFSCTPPFGNCIYAIISGTDDNGNPFYAESDVLPLVNEGTEDISCNCVFPDANPQIGETYTFTYALSGGSGSYTDVRVHAEFVSVHDNCGHDLDNQSIDLGSSSSGNVSFVPKAGTFVILWLYGKDAETNQIFSFDLHEGWLPVEANPACPVTFAFDQEDYKVGDTLTVDYQIDNLSGSLVDGEIWWILVDKYGFTDHHNTTCSASGIGSSSFQPSYGNVVYAVLEGKDESGDPIYAESRHITLGESGQSENTGGYECEREDGKYKVSFAFTNAYAEIGHPFPIEYSVSGGSGSYTDLHFTIVFCTGGYYVHHSLTDYVNEPSGTWNMTAPAGKEAVVYLAGKDAKTGEGFSCEAGKNIQIRQNPDLPVTFIFDKEEYSAGDTVNVQYEFAGLTDELAEGQFFWTIRRPSYYDVNVNEYTETDPVKTTASSGSCSYTPGFGNGIFFTVEGTTLTGVLVYAESEVIPVSGFAPSVYNMTLLPPEEIAEIGHPFPIEYSVSGGSGSYSDLHLDAVLCTKGGWVNHILNENVQDSSGICYMTAPAGSLAVVYIGGCDAITGEKFYSSGDCVVSFVPDPDYPVAFSFDRDAYLAGETVNVQYSIAGMGEQLTDGKIRWTIRKSEALDASWFESEELEQQAVTASSGFSSLSPMYGTGVYFTVEGKTTDGKPVFAESEIIPISGISPDMVQKLPASLTRIESQAFAGTAFIAVEIPASVTYIDDHAFDGSHICLIVGHNDCARLFADKINVDYIGR